MGYAAEEVGLRGSDEIAKDFRAKDVKVVGKMQLDMTNYKGSEEDIVLVSDYTNRAQNEFTSQLIEEYVQVKWGWTSCGYACSDHASWHRQGFPASMPFEALKDDMNSKIHTKDDTLENSGGHAGHAKNFAKLALSFVIEMAK